MRLRRLLFLSLGSGAAGCTGAVVGSASSGDAEAVAATSAIVIVERTGGSAEGARAAASARFVRVAAPSSIHDGLRTIGAAGDLPASGTCASLSSLAGGVATGEPAAVVELVDVGAVSLESFLGGPRVHVVQLFPRQLPDVTDVVTGIVYARATDAALLPPAASYVVHVAGATPSRGGPLLGPFELSAQAPADPSDVVVDGERQDQGMVSLKSGIAIHLTWALDGTADLVFVDIQPAGVRCVLGDGRLGVEGRGRSSVSSSLLDDAGTLVVHRQHREALKAPGLEAAEIRFDFARELTYVRL